MTLHTTASAILPGLLGLALGLLWRRRERKDRGAIHSAAYVACLEQTVTQWNRSFGGLATDLGTLTRDLQRVRTSLQEMQEQTAERWAVLGATLRESAGLLRMAAWELKPVVSASSPGGQGTELFQAWAQKAARRLEDATQQLESASEHLAVATREELASGQQLAAAAQRLAAGANTLSQLVDTLRESVDVDAPARMLVTGRAHDAESGRKDHLLPPLSRTA